jgi:hypothetical protein
MIVIGRLACGYEGQLMKVDGVVAGSVSLGERLGQRLTWTR